jgi:hypothetical protein
VEGVSGGSVVGMGTLNDADSLRERMFNHRDDALAYLLTNGGGQCQILMLRESTKDHLTPVGRKE